MTATANPAGPEQGRRGFSLPSAYTILFLLIIIVALLTWIIPAGAYDVDPNGEPIPGAPGTVTNYTVNGLVRQTTYYFAVKVADNAGNVSALSNVVNTTTPDQTAPAAIRDLVVGLAWFSWRTTMTDVDRTTAVALRTERAGGGR